MSFYLQFTRSKKPEMKYDGNFTLTTQISDEEKHDHLHEGSLQNWKRVLKTVIGFSGMWSSCAIASIVALTTPLPWFQALCLPACLCLLSLCWHPKVQVYIVRSSDGFFLGRWKATCLYTIFKIVILLVGLSIVMVIRLQEHGVLDKNFFHKLYDGLYACRHKEIFYPLIIHFVSGVLGHIIAYISATLCFTGVGITLPTLMATPASIVMVMFLCSPTFHWLDEVMCHSHGTGIWCACTLACITWIAPYVIRGRDFMINTNIILKPYDELFIQPTWNSIFLEQHLSLNYKPEGFSGTEHITHPKVSTINRVFICTTMYREADFEMGRLLKSLHKVATSEKLKKIYMEAHIFLDNGAKDLHLMDFASQLVSLLESTMEVNADKANAYSTPYGVQLNWSLPGGMPFFIHLKDSMKVKAKKRWSQVMYMSYVLNYRVTKDHSREKIHPIQVPRIAAIADDSLFVGYASDKEWEKNTVSLSHSEERPTHSSPTPSTNTNGSTTPYYVRQNRQHLQYMMSEEEGMEQSAGGRTDDGSTPITNIISRIGPELFQQISSDQGIGVSDSLSISSVSSLRSQPEETDFSTTTSRQNSVKHINASDAWQDVYEGDLSSNNESSLTSTKAKRAQYYLDYTDSYRPILPHLQNFRNQDRYSRPKRPQHPVRNQKTKPRCKGPSSPKSHLLQHQDSNISTSVLQEVATENPAYIEDEDVTPKSTDTFVINRKLVPAKNKIKKRAPLDDDTYILATDADMEFDENSVVDLLDLCSRDRRLGGACGRTHPIGMKTGPLVWYQKFEYAKGRIMVSFYDELQSFFFLSN